MGRVVDITSKISNEPSFIKIGLNSYKVDDSKNNVIKIMNLLEAGSNELEMIDEVFKLAIGKKGFDEINKTRVSFNDYQVYFIGIMAALINVSYEEAEKRFQDAK